MGYSPQGTCYKNLTLLRGEQSGSLVVQQHLQVVYQEGNPYPWKRLPCFLGSRGDCTDQVAIKKWNMLLRISE